MGVTVKERPSALILVVDADNNERLMIRCVLEEEGYRVAEAGTGDEALAICEHTRPDVILLDVQVPDIDVLTLCARLGHLTNGGSTSILMILTEENRDIIERAFEVGVADYITRPIHKVILRRRVCTLLQTREVEAGYQDLFDGFGVGIYRSTPSGRIVSANTALAEMLGYPDRESLLAANAVELYVTPEDREHWWALLEREGVVRDHVMPLRRRDGEVIWTRRSARVVRDDRGQVLYHEGVTQDITARRRAEEALRHREAILEAVSVTASQFLRTSDWEKNTQDVLARLGRATEVSRVYIFENHVAEDGTLLTSQRYEWVAPGVTPQIDNPALQNFPCVAGGFGRWVDALSKGEIIYGHVRQFPESEREILLAQDIKSILVVPIFVEGAWWGFIGFDECWAEREWTTAEIQALRTAASILGAAIQRRRTEEKSRRQATELKVVGEVLRALNATPRVQDAFPEIVRGLRAITGCDRISLALIDDTRQWFTLVVLDQPRHELSQGMRLPLRDTAAAADILAGRPHLTPDLAAETHFSGERMLCQAGHRSRINLPLRVDDRSIGALNLTWKEVEGYDVAQLPLLGQIADAIALAVERGRLLAAEARRRQEAEVLREATAALTSALNMDQVLESILIHLEQVVPYDSACVFLREGDRLQVMAARGFPNPDEVIGHEHAADEALFQELERTRRPLHLSDARADPRFKHWYADYVRGWMAVPLITHGNVIGYLTLDSRRVAAYGEVEAALAMAFAAQAAVALDNAQLYQEAVDANKKLEEALHLRDEMIRNVSHELRTPLTLILGCAELLTGGNLGPLDERAYRAADTIVRQADHLAHLVNQLLSFQRLEQRTIVMGAMSVAPWLQRVATAWEAVLAASGLQLRLDVAGDVGEVRGSQDYLQQVVNNLLDNARKFSPNGGTVTLRAWREGGEVHIAVSDEGVGVSPENLPRIFERFYQVDDRGHDHFGGLGLGLSLCQEIVRRHSGRIWAESEGEGKGLTVTFTLPALRADSNGL